MRLAKRRAFCRLLAQRGLRGLGRVPGALRRLPRLVQGDVASCRRALRWPAHPAARPPVGSADARGSTLSAGSAAAGVSGGSGEQPVEFGAQRAVARRVSASSSASLRWPREGRSAPCTRACAGPSTCSAGRLASLACRYARAPRCRGRRQARRRATSARRAGAAVAGLGRIPDERLQRAAQPPGSDAHLVHGVRASRGEPPGQGPELGGLGAEVSHHHVASRRAAGEPRALRGPAADARAVPVCRRSGELGHGGAVCLGCALGWSVWSFDRPTQGSCGSLSAPFLSPGPGFTR